jgi:hypothetical protein
MEVEYVKSMSGVIIITKSNQHLEGGVDAQLKHFFWQDCYQNYILHNSRQYTTVDTQHS